jgi:uncharacterized protein YuzE
MNNSMAEVKVYYDRTGNTLTVWFGNPADEHICEETGDEIVLMKDKSGRVIGFEKLNFLSLDQARDGSAAPGPMRVAFEATEV